jgi:putative acetyltransferase
MNALETDLIIREFEPGDELAFRQLNEAWIKHYFAMEAEDEHALADPRGAILSGGGRIFFAVQQGQTVGCCALRAMGPREYEVAKMAVAESVRRNGVGRRLLTRVVEAARAAGAARLYLETNHVLTPAIRLYESVGFRHLPPERIVPSPYARADVYMEMWLDR